MYKNLSLILGLCVAVFYISCNKPDIQFNNQYLDNGYTQIIKVDTFTSDVSTVYIDSFITSGKGVVLAGNYNDPIFGKIASQSFLEVGPPTYQDQYQFTTFDSLILVMKVNKNYYGDTTSPVNITVNRLLEKIVPPNSGYNIFNVDSFAYDPLPIASKNIVISPNKTDTVSIRLNDALGKLLLQKLQNPNDNDMKSNTNFVEFFNGLRIGSSSAKMIVGFADSVSMRLHYKQTGLYLQSKRLDFTIVNTAHQFNNITVNKTGTPLQNLNSAVNEIHSSLTKNAGYAQSVTGSMIKVTFPTLREVYKLPNYVKILRAQLIVRPLFGSFNTDYPLPPKLRLVTTTQLNQLGGDIPVIGSNGMPSQQTGNLFIDNLYGQNTNYTYDVTYYLQSQLTSFISNNRNGLLLAPPTGPFETQFNRVVIGNKLNTLGKIELDIYYAAVQ